MNDVIEQLGQSMHQLPEIYEPALSHYQAQGLYGRRIYVPAGVCVVTMVHKQEHFTVALKGRCRVVNEQGQEAIVEAPAVFVTQPGTQRACYAETDVEWLTVHAVPEIRDIMRMDEVLCDPDLATYQARLDYQRVIAEIGMPELEAREMSERPFDQLGVCGAQITLKPSPLQGIGVFSTADYAPGEAVGYARIGEARTEIGRYTNHSPTPNGVFLPDGKGIILRATTFIKSGEEITIDYRQVLKLVGGTP